MRKNVLPALTRAVVVAVGAAVLTSACASAAKRYEQGQELEARGRPADAAARYVDALRRDATLVEARAGLLRAGGLAVDEYLEEAAAADAAGRPTEGADALLRLDALRRDASAVGVPLDVPPDYAVRRRGLFDRAIGASLHQSRVELGARAWNDALRGLDRAVDRWEPAPHQRAALDSARFSTFLAWGEYEGTRGRHRAAYDVAERALGTLGSSHPLADRALALQAEALRRGTVRVAMLPVGAEAGVRRTLHEDFIPELNDVLAEGPWMRPPLFLEVADPAQVSRDVRRHGYARQTIAPAEAARVGRAIGAALVVIAEIDSVRAAETGVRETRRTVRTRAGADTAYVVREGRTELWTRVAYAVVDTRTARVLEEGAASGEAAVRFRRGEYAGDPRTLELPRGDRDLFSPDAEAATQRTLVRQTAEAVSARLSRQVYDRLLRRVD